MNFSFAFFPLALDFIECKRTVTRYNIARAPEKACRVRCGSAASPFEHDDAAWGRMSARCREDTRDLCVVGRVGRVEQDDVKSGVFSERLKRAKRAGPNNSISGRNTAVRQVLGNERLRAAILLDERHVAGPSAEGLDAHGASARVRIDDPRPGDARREDVEQRL